MKRALLLPILLLVACNEDQPWFVTEQLEAIAAACTANGGFVEKTETFHYKPYSLTCTAAPLPKTLETVIPPKK